jgi:hypothetical protein
MASRILPFTQEAYVRQRNELLEYHHTALHLRRVSEEIGDAGCTGSGDGAAKPAVKGPGEDERDVEGDTKMAGS